MVPLPSPQEYAYGLLRALTTGELEDGLQVSFLINGSRYSARPRIKEAIRLLKEDGFIKVQQVPGEGKGRKPDQIFLQYTVRTNVQ